MQPEGDSILHAEAVVFDMDGTLVDSTGLISRIWRQWSVRHGIDTDTLLLASRGRKAIETVRQFAPPSIDPATEAELLSRLAAEETEGLQPMTGAAALLHAIPKERWAIVTSAERELATNWLMHVGLPLPSILIAAEDVVTGKPDPEGYLLAAKRLNCAPANLVVFEDAQSGLAAAAAAGATLVAVGHAMHSDEATRYKHVSDFSRVKVDECSSGTLVLRLQR